MGEGQGIYLHLQLDSSFGNAYSVSGYTLVSVEKSIVNRLILNSQFKIPHDKQMGIFN